MHTSYGDYKPDIIITTTIGKIFYFEIKVSNKKSGDYAPKWDELGNDVVEVDTRDFINQKYNNNIPTLKLIYSDGQCFIDNYLKKEYMNSIIHRKLEWKQKDKTNYRIHWERLDRFWKVLQDYRYSSSVESNVVEYFNRLDYEDKIWCYQTIKNPCSQLNELFRDNINQYFYDMLDDFREKYTGITITLVHKSPLIYEVICKYQFLYLNYSLFEEENVKVYLEKGKILSIKYFNEIESAIQTLMIKVKNGNKILDDIKEFSKLDYIKCITPKSHWFASNYPLHDLYFSIEFQDNIRSKYIKENIGYEVILNKITYKIIKEYYAQYKKWALQKLEKLFFEKFILQDSILNQKIELLRNEYKKTDLCLSIKTDFNTDNCIIYLKIGHSCLFGYIINPSIILGTFEDEVYDIFIKHISEQVKLSEKIIKFVNTINECKNKMWSAELCADNSIYLSLYNIKTEKEIKCVHIDLCYCKTSYDIKNKIYKVMKDLLEWAENYKGIRFLEAR